ncbi:ABC transporter ATP-binding protein [Klenkia sp. PcliD-1-E]|uniref:ABC transporter ATP-binding protein n=1 Tax=Klenkia sp. PcliD-1-E TaxID=2954492 RepID=UPI00209685B0|nr:ABC transporter ATP-binding protein [Klenkia sp. PcliD-1-E]MCO7219998.1 ABC transporter ATP-binding protein [Klenkia sp. PcliD-1-E]
MTDVIRVHNVTKEFALRKDKSLKERLVNARRSKEHAEAFTALRDIDLVFSAGSTTGLIGHNGSGKSTLLKIIGGILTPTTGYVERRGRLAALLELGAGFHGDLTGRENVYLNASILGLTRRQVDQYFDAIVDFSGIEEFIDTQVKFYSSGMYVRLAFAVAVHVDPEILLVDEVLSVGDEPFQRKCLDRIRRFQREGRTIVFVSHGLDQVRQLCDRAVLLDHGTMLLDGTPTQAVRMFRDLNQEAAESDDTEDDAESGDRRVLVSDVAVHGRDGEPVRTVSSGAELGVSFSVSTDRPLSDWIVGVAIEDSGGQVVWGANSDKVGVELPRLDAGTARVAVDFPEVPLAEGIYQFSVAIADTGNRTVFHRVNRVATFRVVTDAVEDGTVHLVPAYSVAGDRVDARAEAEALPRP